MVMRSRGAEVQKRKVAYDHLEVVEPLVHLLHELLPVLGAELVPAQLLPRVELHQGGLDRWEGQVSGVRY